MELDILEEKDEKFISKSITMLFKDIQEFKMKEIFSWDFIYDLVLKTETKNNETLFLLADDNLIEKHGSGKNTFYTVKSN